MLTFDDVDRSAWLAGRTDDADDHPVHSRWMRARALGVPYRIAEAPSALGRASLSARRDRVAPLLSRVDGVLGNAIGELNRRGFAVALADQDGVILRCWGGSALAERGVRSGFGEGACWSEAVRGTNAIGTALAERTSVAVLGRSHYAFETQGLACYAALVRDPLSSAVGVLDITGPFTGADPLLGVLVESLASSVESALFAEVEKRSRRGHGAIAAPLGHALSRAREKLSSHGIPSRSEANVWAAFGELAIESLADWCLIDAVVDGRHVRKHVATAVADRRWVAEGLYRYPIDATRAHPALTAMRTRRGVLMRVVPPKLLDAMACDEEHRRLLAAMDPASVIAVPMLGTVGPIGSVTLVSSRPGVHFGPADVELAEMFAGYVALGCENAERVHDLRQALSIRDEVLAMVAHDLRSPLNAISLSATVLERRLRSHARESRSVQAIAHSTQRMSRMVEDLLEVARIESGTLSVVSQRCPAAAIVEAAREIAQTTAGGLRLTVECSAGAPDVVADRDRTLQIFANLIGNAAKFTPEGGLLTVGCAPADGRVRFWVRDSGAGIPREDLDKLFERGWQARPGDRRGAGLGLYICKALVAAQQGEIWAESEVGRGATFSFTLPAAHLY